MIIRNFCWLVICGFFLGSCTTEIVKDRKVRAGFRTALSAPACEYQPGQDKTLILIGRVALNQEAVVEREIYIANGVISEIAEVGKITKEKTKAARLTCKNSFFSPGLVNAHEHTGFSYLFPVEDMKHDYQHRLEWRKGGEREFKKQPESTKDISTLVWIELRHLLSGTTTVAGSGGVDGIVRNVSSRNEIGNELVDLKTDPFSKGAIDNLKDVCSGSVPITAKVELDHYQSQAVPHVGEGVNCLAEKELEVYLDYVSKNPHRQFSLIHGVNLQEKHLKQLKENGVSVIWSPRSNVALYGKSLDPIPLIDNSIRVSLGTDWSPSGSFNLFEEMRCAKTYSAVKSSRPVEDKDLWVMSTVNSAHALGLVDKVGVIDVGNYADIIVVSDLDNKGLDNFSRKKPDDVLAVFVGGELIAGEQGKFLDGTMGKKCLATYEHKFICIDFEKGYQQTFEQIVAKNTKNVDLLTVEGQAQCEFP